MTQVNNSVGTIHFTVLHKNEEPTKEEILAGLLRRVSDLMESDHVELVEAVSTEDTYKTTKWS